jgi:hypothetical protein
MNYLEATILRVRWSLPVLQSHQLPDFLVIG